MSKENLCFVLIIQDRVISLQRTLDLINQKPISPSYKIILICNGTTALPFGIVKDVANKNNYTLFNTPNAMPNKDIIEEMRGQLKDKYENLVFFDIMYPDLNEIWYLTELPDLLIQKNQALSNEENINKKVFHSGIYNSSKLISSSISQIINYQNKTEGVISGLRVLVDNNHHLFSPTFKFEVLLLDLIRPPKLLGSETKQFNLKGKGIAEVIFREPIIINQGLYRIRITLKRTYLEQITFPYDAKADGTILYDNENRINGKLFMETI